MGQALAAVLRGGGVFRGLAVPRTVRGAAVALLVALLVGAALVDPSSARGDDERSVADDDAAEIPLPQRRFAPCAAMDGEARRLVVFGGRSEAAATHFSDAWELDLTAARGRGRWSRVSGAGADGAPLGAAPQWSEIPPSGVRPPARASHTLTYDAGRDRMWLIAGTRPGSDLADTWSLDLATMTWDEITPPGCPAACPSPRSGHVVGYDDRLDQLVLYGGLDSSAGSTPADAWALSGLDGEGTWDRLDVESAVPQARFVPVGAFDERGRRLVVFGGGFGAAAYRDTIALHVPLRRPPFWRSVAPITPFTARDQVATILSDEGVVTAFGGFGSGTFPGAVDAGLHLADTWQLSLDDGGRRRWHNVTATNPVQVPLTREAVALAHDVERDRAIVFGGLNGDVSLNDVWVARTNSGAELGAAVLANIVRHGSRAALGCSRRVGRRRSTSGRVRWSAQRRLGPVRHMVSRARTDPSMGTGRDRQLTTAQPLGRRRRLRFAAPPDGRVRRPAG